MNFSTTMVALLTALFSVAATAAPNLYRWIRRAGTDISVTFLGVRGGDIGVMVANRGSQPGALGAMILNIAPSSDTVHKSYLLDTAGDPNNAFLQGDEIKQLLLGAPRPLPGSEGAYTIGPTARCHLEYEVIGYDGTRRLANVELICAQVHLFLQRNDIEFVAGAPPAQ